MLFEVVMEQQLFNQQIINRFNYHSTTTGITIKPSFALANALGFIPNESDEFPVGTVSDTIRRVQSSDVKYISMLIRNLYDNTDFYSAPFFEGLTGNSGMPGASPVLAYGFRSNRTDWGIRRGFKRIAGVDETAMDTGGNIAPATKTLLGDVAEALTLAATYESGSESFSFNHVVLKKDDYVTPSGKTAYKYFPTLAEQEAHMASNLIWDYYDTVRTQLSRQYGRGS